MPATTRASLNSAAHSRASRALARDAKKQQTARAAVQKTQKQKPAPAAADDKEKDEVVASAPPAADGCPICLEPFTTLDHRAEGHPALGLQCCGTRVCAQCICAHLLSKNIISDLILTPKCPFCFGPFVSKLNTVLISFNRFVCCECDGPVRFFDKACTTSTCGSFRKKQCDYTTKRFSWPLVFEPTAQTEAGLYIKLDSAVLLSYRAGPTIASARYILRPDGGITHIHDDGTPQAWSPTGAPQWVPYMDAASWQFPLCNPR